MRKTMFRWLIVLAIVVPSLVIVPVAGVNQTSSDDVIYVTTSYRMDVSEAYGKREYYYAQGVNVQGEEVSVLIGVDGCTAGDLPVVSELASGFYTFELSTDMEQAKKDVMVATQVCTWEENDSGTDAFCTATLPVGTEFTPGSESVMSEDGEPVKLTETTRYIALAPPGPVVNELDCRLFEGGVTYTLAEQAYVLVERDAAGDLVADTVYLMTAPSNVEPSVVYSVTVEATVGGSVLVDRNEGKIGDVVTVTATAEEGYKAKEILVDGIAIQGNTFSITGDHSVKVVFEKKEQRNVGYFSLEVVNTIVVDGQSVDICRWVWTPYED